MAKKNQIFIDYSKYNQQNADVYFKHCLRILNKYNKQGISKNNQQQLIEELQENLPIIINIYTDKFPLRSLLKFLSKYFLFLAEEEQLQITYKKRLIHTGLVDEVLYIYTIKNLPLGGVLNDRWRQRIY